jgi:hypothetical protein
MGSGKGDTCKFCRRAMLRVVADLDTGTQVRHCYNCGATVFA